MLLRKVAAIALISFGLSACDNGNSADQSNEGESTNPSQEQQQQQQTPPSQQPGQMQQGQQAEAPNISDEELKQFVAIAQELQVINQASQQKMMSAIEAEGMKVDRFTQIQQAQQDPNQESDATAEEMKTFEAANKKLEEVQMSSQAEMTKKLEDAGLSQEWYQQTAMAIQSNQELMMRFQQLQQGGNPNQGAPAQGGDPTQAQ
ncbi:MAG: hypothetical protein WD530_01565 [Vicingaceae bacterium]